MEKEKSKSMMTIVIILIIMVLGLGGYIIYDKVSSSKTNENNSATNVAKKQISINEEQAKKLFEKIRKYENFIYKDKFEKSKILKVNDFDKTTILGLLMYEQNIKSSSNKICGTGYETELINDKKIGSKGEQADCSSISIYSDEDVERAKRELYGDNVVLPLSSDDLPGFYYYEKAKVWLDSFCCTGANDAQYDGYETNENVVVIKTTTSDRNEKYNFNFKYENGNYMLYSVEKVL